MVADHALVRQKVYVVSAIMCGVRLSVYYYGVRLSCVVLRESSLSVQHCGMFPHMLHTSQTQ
jgi:hypothetical protein